MPIVDKSSLVTVAVDSMNQIHHEEADMINELDELMQGYGDGSVSEADLDAKLDAFLQHMTAHFHGEEVEMEAIAFPPYRIHKSEHDFQIDKARQTIEQWKQSRELEPLADYFRRELPQWLDQHIATMDNVTARFFAMNGREVSLES